MHFTLFVKKKGKWKEWMLKGKFLSATNFVPLQIGKKKGKNQKKLIDFQFYHCFTQSLTIFNGYIGNFILHSILFLFIRIPLIFLPSISKHIKKR